MNGRDTPSQGNAHRWHAPHNVYPCLGDDDWIAIDVGSDRELAALCGVLGLDDPLTDARFTSAQQRRLQISALDETIAEATAGRDKEELFHALQAAGVCAAPTHNAVEALNDPQLDARGFLEELPTGDDRQLHRYPGLMFRMKRTPNALRSPPARLGEHNREIYRGLLGYDEADLDALERRGLVATAFPASIWQPPQHDQ